MNLYLTKKDVEHVIPTRVPTAIVETHDDKDNDDDKAELAAVKLELATIWALLNGIQDTGLKITAGRSPVKMTS